MTGWRKRQIADQVEQNSIASEWSELRALLNDSRYFTMHYGMATSTESEKLARAMHLTAVNKILGIDGQNPPRPMLPIDD